MDLFRPAVHCGNIDRRGESTFRIGMGSWLSKKKKKKSAGLPSAQRQSRAQPATTGCRPATRGFPCKTRSDLNCVPRCRLFLCYKTAQRLLLSWAESDPRPFDRGWGCHRGSDTAREQSPHDLITLPEGLQAKRITTRAARFDGPWSLGVCRRCLGHIATSLSGTPILCLDLQGTRHCHLCQVRKT